MTDLGTLAGALVASWGLSINDSGVVVGYSDYQSTYHAFVYSGGKMKDLNKLISPGSGWVLDPGVWHQQFRADRRHRHA